MERKTVRNKYENFGTNLQIKINKNCKEMQTACK